MFVSCNNPLKRTLLYLFLLIQLPISASNLFIGNKGQWDHEAKYKLKAFQKDIWITSSGIRTCIYNLKKNPSKIQEVLHDTTPLEYEVFDLNFIHSNINTRFLEIDTKPTAINYISQNGNFQSYLIGSLIQQEIYTKVDLQYYLNSKEELEYDFIIHPGGEIKDIQTQINGIKNISLDQEGNLILKTTYFKDLIIHKPLAYQWINGKKNEVEISFQLDNHILSFYVTSYDKNIDLIIDPSLKYSTFLYCAACEDLAADNDINLAGELVVAGYTLNTGFPTTLGAFQTILGNANFIQYDAYVSKLNATGSNLIFSTFLGGSSQDIAYSVAYDNLNNIVVTGKTTSANFPKNNAINNVYQGGFDGFLTKLNPAGNALIFSTYVGGNSFDECKSVTIDQNNNIYVV